MIHLSCLLHSVSSKLIILNLKKNMELQTKSIIELHKIDKKLDHIEEQKGDLPSLIDEQEEIMNSSKETVADCQETIKSLEKDRSKNQINLDESKSLLDKYNKQIFQVKNNKEYDAILKEIDHIESQHKDLSLQMKDIDETIKEKTEEISELTDKINSIEIKLVDYTEELKILSVETKTEEINLNDTKEKILNSITDKNFLFRYNEDQGNGIVSSVSSESCDNCFSGLPVQLVLNIKKGTKLYSCPDCGIYLYFDEDGE